MPEPAPRPSFSAINPLLQLALDSTSLDALKRCPQYYKYNIIDGYTRGDKSADLIFGSLFHSATEFYDRKMASGSTHNEAVELTIEQTLLSSYDPETATFPFRNTDNPTKNLYTLLRAIVWYLDRFEHDHLKTVILANGKPAVELSFQINLSALVGDGTEFVAYTGESYILCGHLDKVVEWLGEYRFKDTKTTRSQLDQKYFAKFLPNIQVTIYSIAMSVIFHEDRKIGGALIDAIQTQVNGNRFARQQISVTPGHLNEFLTDLTFLLRELESYAQADHWPKRESRLASCSIILVHTTKSVPTTPLRGS
jgi:hypothetical protein